MISKRISKAAGVDSICGEDAPRPRSHATIATTPVYPQSDERGRAGVSYGLRIIRQLYELVAAHVEEPDQMAIGIEIDRGLWVDADRGRLSGVSDQAVGGNCTTDRHHILRRQIHSGDAKLLADLVRHRPAQPPPDRRRQRREGGSRYTARRIRT